MLPTVITVAPSVSAPRISAGNQERRQVQTFRRLVFRITPGQTVIMCHDGVALPLQFPDVANSIPPSWRHLQAILGQKYYVLFGDFIRNTVTSRTGCRFACYVLHVRSET